MIRYYPFQGVGPDVVLCCLFWCQFLVIFHLRFVHKTLSSGLFAEWILFGKELPTRLTICAHCLLTIRIFFYLFPILVLRYGFDSPSSCSLFIYYFH